MTIAGFTPERRVLVGIGVDLFDASALKKHGDHLFGGSPVQTFGQRHCATIGALGSGGENASLGRGKISHLRIRLHQMRCW